MAQALGLCVFDTAIGACGIAWGAHALVGVQLPEIDAQHTIERMRRRFPGVDKVPPPPWVSTIVVRVQALLEGEHDDLADVPLDLADVPDFNQRVYVIARAIEPGRTMTYGDIARVMGAPGSSRAVGQALGHNPFAPVVPCHRVLAAGNAGGGFSADGGVATKLKMLEIERARMGSEPGLFD